MLTHTNNLPLQTAEPKTFNKAQEILKKNLSESDTCYQKTKQLVILNKDITNKSNKFEFLRKLATSYIKKNNLSFSTTKLRKSVSTKNLRNFYFGYKLSFYSLFVFIKLKIMEATLDRKNKGNNKNRKKLLKYYSKVLYLFLVLFKRINSRLTRMLTYLSKQCSKSFKGIKINFLFNFYKILANIFPVDFILKLSYKIDKQSLEFYYSLIKLFKQKINWIRFKKIFSLLKKNRRFYSSNSNNIFKSLTNLFYYLSSIKLDKENFYSIFGRINLIVKIYTIPFLFLATQALIPTIDEYEYIIINPLASIIFNKIPFLIDLIKFVRPVITNPVLLFWVPLSFYLIFPSGYRTLKIPYKTAFNGTIAAIFLIINYCCVLLQFMMKLAFDSIKIVKDIFFTSYLIKHLGKNKNKERDEAVKIFANLVTRYDSEIRKNYYDFLLILNHRIFSHLALISLAALVYNCIYYIVHNKNPEIILVTKTALATIKNPQEEE